MAEYNQFDTRKLNPAFRMIAIANNLPVNLNLLKKVQYFGDNLI